MKIIFAVLLAFSIYTSSTFPSITGETLNKEEITLPLKNTDKLTLIAVAYSSKSEDSFKEWAIPLYDKFILRRGMFDKEYDIHTFFIPMFTGIKQSGYSKAMKTLRNNSHENLYDHIVFYKGSLDPYKTDLHLDKKDKPYLFLLDKNGNIIHRIEGKYSDVKLEELEDAISSFLK